MTAADRARDLVNTPPPAPPSSGQLLGTRRQSDGADSVRVLKPRRAAPADAVRPTRAEVNLAALRHNLRVVTRHAYAANGERARVWPVLKADGYGHGAPAVARTLERAGAEGFCVALLEEAVELRDAGIRAPILVMGGFNASSRGTCEEIAARDVVPVVYDLGQVEGLARAARANGREAVAHLKVDTGMARLGVRMNDLERFAEQLRAYPEVRIAGLMTHLACADAEEGAPEAGFTAEQVARFEEATRRLGQAGAIGPAVVRHAANSAALLRGDAVFDAVRPGIAIFGVASMLGAPSGVESLKAAMRVRSEIVDVRSIDAGEGVGYGSLFRASRPSRIATIPMGYADGLSRQLSNRGHVLVRGRRAPIVGAVSMDMSMIDVTDVPGSGLADEVVVLGSQEGALGKDAIGADEVAGHAGTIAWEILTSISRRVPRFYREP
ncbi:MAG: Alanine racemase [Labilithrix sp.]|nr:Alanine racemase [Labilithrix sp.]